MQKGFRVAGVALVAGALFVGVQPAQASIYNNTFNVTASEGTTNGGFDTASGDPFVGMTNTASASFKYTGPLDFGNTAPQNSGAGDTNSLFGFSMSNISAYNGSGNVVIGMSPPPVARFNNKANFLASSASAGSFQYGTYFTFDLGVVTSGTVLTITHDDGISLFQGTSQIGTTTSGATGAVTETVRIDTTGDTILRYSRQNGTPSILQVAVPEPMSMALLGAGLAGLGLVRRKKRAV